MKKILYLVVLIFTKNLYSQTSIFQDSKGEAAYKIFDNALSINTSDQSLTFNVFKLKRDNNANVPNRDIFNRKGVSLKLNAKEGVSNLKLKDEFAIDGELGIYIGKKRTVTPGPGVTTSIVRERYISATIGIDRNNFFFVENNSIKTDFISDPTFKLEFGQFGYVKTMLYGFSLNGGYRSNISELKANNILNVVQTVNNGNVQIVNEESAFDRSKYDAGLGVININGDIGFQINKKQVKAGTMPSVSIAGHFRYLIQEGFKPKFNPAIGIYFAAEEGAPQKISFGVNAQIVDAFDNGGMDNSVWERTAITLNAGYRF